MATEGIHDSNVYIGKDVIKKLNSIQNVSFSQNVQEEPSLTVGKGEGPTIITQPTQVTVSIDKILNGEDFIRTLTGTSSLSGQFEYGDNLLDFDEACMENFSVSADVGQLPQASFDFTIYGSISGSSVSLSSTSSADNEIKEIPTEGLIATFDIANKPQTNSIQSFTYSEIINKEVIYGIGNNKAADIKFISPIRQEASIAIEVEDYSPEETFSFLNESKDRNRSIKLEISGDGSILNTYELENAYLVNESVTLGVGNTATANLLYRGY